jgi:hypothetical protein
LSPFSRWVEWPCQLCRGYRGPVGRCMIYNLKGNGPLDAIRHCRFLDMTLTEIATCSDSGTGQNKNCSQVDALLDEHIEHLATRIKELKLLQNNGSRSATFIERGKIEKEVQ